MPQVQDESQSPIARYLGGQDVPIGEMAGGIVGNQGWGRGAMYAGLGLADRISRGEDKARSDTLGFLKGQFNQANAASQTAPGDLGLRMGRATDAASGQALDQWKGLRDMLGGAGVTGGGLAAGLGSQIELGRLNQIQGSKRDLAIFETERRAKSASDQFLRSLGVADVMNQGPSVYLSDYINSVADQNTNLQLGNMQLDAAKQSAKAQKQSGLMSGIGQLFGGALSLFGG